MKWEVRYHDTPDKAELVDESRIRELAGRWYKDVDLFLVAVAEKPGAWMKLSPFSSVRIVRE